MDLVKTREFLGLVMQQGNNDICPAMTEEVASVSTPLLTSYIGLALNMQF